MGCPRAGCISEASVDQDRTVSPDFFLTDQDSGTIPMYCPKCIHGKMKVLQTEAMPDGSVRRRRKCLTCDHRTTTFERADDAWLAAAIQLDRIEREAQEQRDEIRTRYGVSAGPK